MLCLAKPTSKHAQWIQYPESAFCLWQVLHAHCHQTVTLSVLQQVIMRDRADAVWCWKSPGGGSVTAPDVIPNKAEAKGASSSVKGLAAVVQMAAGLESSANRLFCPYNGGKKLDSTEIIHWDEWNIVPLHLLDLIYIQMYHSSLLSPSGF